MQIGSRGLLRFAARSLLERRGRWALTGLAVVLGVANLFGVAVATESTKRAFTQRASSLLGIAGADVQVAPADPVNEREAVAASIPALAAAPGVERVVAVDGYWPLEAPRFGGNSRA